MAETHQQARRRQLSEARDTRVDRTRSKLVEAMRAELTHNAEPSIGQICKRASVARSTFYTHFATLDDLALYATDTFFDQLSELDVARRQEAALSGEAIMRLGVTELLERFDDQRGLLRFAMRSGSAEPIERRIAARWVEGARSSILVERPDADEVFVQLAATWFAGGLLAVIRAWLDAPEGISKDALLDAVVKLSPTWLTS